MSALRIIRKKSRKRVSRVPEELLVALPGRNGAKPERVALQWHDGAGELHVATLTPAQSWPYLN